MTTVRHQSFASSRQSLLAKGNCQSNKCDSSISKITKSNIASIFILNYITNLISKWVQYTMSCILNWYTPLTYHHGAFHTLIAQSVYDPRKQQQQCQKNNQPKRGVHCCVGISGTKSNVVYIDSSSVQINYSKSSRELDQKFFISCWRTAKK